ncbi:hypothetical protein ACPYO6_08120 [Georgenia sp. Z1344]|uniref:hypothetical protein n=1 Tax=Georgenia sp. Z1344 TaxID=3416706 RepID=UPI003CE6F05F
MLSEDDERNRAARPLLEGLFPGQAAIAPGPTHNQTSLECRYCSETVRATSSALDTALDLVRTQGVSRINLHTLARILTRV